MKLRPDTYVRISYTDNFRATGGTERARWELRFNDNGCTDPGPINNQITAHTGDNNHHGSTIIGYCKATSAGPLGAATIRITVRTYNTLCGGSDGNPYTGWFAPGDCSDAGSGSQFVLEAQEVY